MTWVRRCLAAVLTVGLAASATAAGAAGAAGAGTAQPDHAGTTRTVTLATGDRVEVTTTPGRAPGVDITPGPGRDDIVFSTYLRAGRVYVVPSDAVPELAAGRTDGRTFDVTGQAGGRPTALLRKAPAAAASYTVRVTLIDRAGRVLDDPEDPAFDGPVWLENVADGDLIPLEAGAGHLQVKAPSGRYTLVTSVRSPDESLTLLAAPKLQVTADTAVTLDARQANPVDLTVEAPDAKLDHATLGIVQDSAVPGSVAGSLIDVRQEVPLYALQTTPVTDQKLLFYYREQLSSARGRYDVLVGAPDRIPADPRYTLRDSNLSQVDVSISQPGIAVPGVWRLSMWLPLEISREVELKIPVQGPGKHTVLVNPVLPDGQPALWTDSFEAQPTADDPYLHYYQEWGEYYDSTFHAGQRVPIAYGTAAFGVGAGGWWSDETGVIGISELVASTGRNLSPSSRYVGTGRMWRDGEVIAEYGPIYDGFEFEPSARRANYKLEFGNQPGLDSRWAAYGTDVTGRWTFVAAREPGSGYVDLPLLNTRLTGPFDELGRAPVGRPFPLTLHAGDGKRTTRLVWATVSLSYDDGRTWRSVPLAEAADGTWRGTVTHPRTSNGFVATRVNARAANGSGVSYTVKRAYGLLQP
jgi:hypothetical protein